MTPLEIKKMKAELAAVLAARLNIEVRIEEQLNDVARLQEHVKVQEAKEKELEEKLAAAN
jgi:hypothetical protein